MQRFRTHYDNLKVSRDAPIEVIQAAYRSLARKHHPDRTGGTSESEAIMKSINASYEVLSDPVRRAKHDDWIATQTAKPGHGHAETRADEGVGDNHRSARRREISLGNLIFTVCFFASALSLLRFPGYRLIGIVMLVVGWIYFVVRRR